MRLGTNLLIGLVALMAGAGASLAYIPSSYFIVKSWVDLHQKNKQQNLKVVSKISVLDQAGAQQDYVPSFKEVMIYYPRSETMRSWALDDAGQVLYHRESKQTSWSLPQSLIFVTEIRSLIQALSEFQIPVLNESSVAQFALDSERLKIDQMSLMRFNEKVSWVIAQKNKKKLDSSQTQLWMEKDTFLPLKVVFKGAKNQEFRQVQFDWDDSSVQKVALYPKLTTLLSEDSKVLLRSKLVELSKFSEGSEQELIKHREQGFTSDGEAVSAELKALIKLYYDSIR